MRFRSSMSASPAARSCSPICATASRTGSRPSMPTSSIDSRPQDRAVRQCPQQRQSAEIRDQGGAARAADRAAEHPGRNQDRRARPAARAARGQGRSPAQRLRRDDQRRHRHARRRRVQRLGLGRSREQAAGEARPRFPEACGRDVARHAASPSAQPWSNATIDLNGLNYIDAQARISAAELNIGDGALRARRDRRHARERRAEGAGLQSRRL